MATKTLKHYVRTLFLGEKGYKQFALIALSDPEGDGGVTLVRCKEDKIGKEMRYWGSFTKSDLEKIDALKRDELFYADKKSLVIRLS